MQFLRGPCGPLTQESPQETLDDIWGLSRLSLLEKCLAWSRWRPLCCSTPHSAWDPNPENDPDPRFACTWEKPHLCLTTRNLALHPSPGLSHRQTQAMSHASACSSPEWGQPPQPRDLRADLGGRAVVEQEPPGWTPGLLSHDPLGGIRVDEPHSGDPGHGSWPSGIRVFLALLPLRPSCPLHTHARARGRLERPPQPGCTSEHFSSLSTVGPPWGTQRHTCGWPGPSWTAPRSKDLQVRYVRA